MCREHHLWVTVHRIEQFRVVVSRTLLGTVWVVREEFLDKSAVPAL